MIIKLGGNVMVTDKSERTALHWAAEENQPEIMKVSNVIQGNTTYNCVVGYNKLRSTSAYFMSDFLHPNILSAVESTTFIVNYFYWHSGS